MVQRKEGELRESPLGGKFISNNITDPGLTFILTMTYSYYEHFAFDKNGGFSFSKI